MKSVSRGKLESHGEFKPDGHGFQGCDDKTLQFISPSSSL
jgi:hypothetical protein